MTVSDNMDVILKIFLVSICVSSVKNQCVQPEKRTFLCPLNYAEVGGFEMKISPTNEVLIVCHKLHELDISQIPKITTNQIRFVRFTSCPVPDDGFQKLQVDSFSTEDVILKIEHGNFVNQTLRKNHFRGLEHLKFLQLTNYTSKYLAEDVFSCLSELIALEMKQNSLTKLEGNIFERNRKLEFLDLSDNQLDYLPDDLFRPLTNLEYLRLWNNKLQSLNASTFEGLVNLKTLQLDANRIRSIDEDVFKHLKNLQDVSLGMNELRLIPFNLFRNNHKLQAIELKSNANLTLTDYLFSNMTSLQEIDLAFCDLQEIPEHIFEKSTKLKIIVLRGNGLKEIPENLFKDLIYLEEIDLAENRIESVEEIFSSLKKLRRLFLQDNRLRTISEDAFSSLSSLEELNLENNNISQIAPRAFLDNECLRIINLSRNRYSGEEEDRGILEDVVSIENIDLSHNLITQVEDVLTFDNKWSLEKVDLSYNLIENIALTTLNVVSDTEIFLDHNRITVVSFDDVDLLDGTNTSTIHLEGNPIDCSCNNFDLLNYFNGEIPNKVRKMFNIRHEATCESPESLKSSFLKEVSLSLVTCPLEDDDTCPEKCSCSWRPLDQSVLINCANQNLTKFPQIVANYSRIEINLEHNSLETTDLVGYQNVTKLLLSYNKLRTISWVPAKLEVLKLDHNELSTLSFGILQALNSSFLTNMTLGNNPWTCNCESENLTIFIRQHSKKLDFKNIYCVNSTTRLIYLNRNELCRDFALIYVISTVSLLLLFATSSTLYYRYNQEIKIWLFSKNLCLFWVSEEDIDHDKSYDAFISYCHFDEDFVCELVSELEQGPKPYKLCLHYRDWIPGELISVQIVNSIASSRRTIVVLSENFLKSVWGKAEFQQAHAEAMSGGRSRVIVILYGDINIEGLGSELKAYLKTNTYLKWGDPYFWNKLRYALPHYKNVKL